MVDDDQAKKEHKRKKHRKRMGKLLTRCFQQADSQPFQQSSNSSPGETLDLLKVGSNLDKGVYDNGKSGWEIFARDLGVVYTWHIERNDNHAQVADVQRQVVAGLFTKIDSTLGKIVLESKSADLTTNGSSEKNRSLTAGKKRKISDKENESSSPAKKANLGTNGMTLSQREEKAMNQLTTYLEQRGGDKTQSQSFRCQVAKRQGGRYETTYYSESHKRFKSMAEIARFLNLTKAPAKRTAGKGGKKESDKKKLKRELDKLTKARTKAAKVLEDHNDNGMEQLPIVEEASWDDGSNAAMIHKAGLCLPKSDVESFPGIPRHCLPDLLLVWDFLCTFGRTLSLQPIELDDFSAALSFRPTLTSSAGFEGQEETQQVMQPAQSQIPVYLSECHIALLRLLVKDPSSDLWWWSVLETPEMVEQEDEYMNPVYKKRKAFPAVLKVDLEALLSVDEDPALTRQWYQSLEDVRTRKPDNSGPIKSAVKSAISATTNQHLKAYLKKAMRTWRPKSAGFVKRAVVWLTETFREACPHLWGRSISSDELEAQKKLVIAAATLEMNAIAEDIGNDVGDMDSLEGDSDEDLDSDDDEESDNEDTFAEDQPIAASSTGKLLASAKESEELIPVTTFVPKKPVPSVVDLLLPPAKPVLPTDIVHALTWPPVIGATCSRIFQWYKRRRNEVDDSIREFRELRPMSIAERRRRESIAASRIMSECGERICSTSSHIESAIGHLCGGKDYLDLTSVQRLCLLRILVEAVYDTHHVQLSIEDNFKARTNAVKSLEAEERKAKKAAKEEASTLDAAARERLSNEARDAFFDKKRQDLIDDMKETGEYSVEFIEQFTDDDIIDLDDETKAEYEALPTPESFSKAEINAVVKMIQDESALGVDRLSVLTLAEIERRDENYLKSLQDEIGGEMNSRETIAKVDRLRQRITRFTDDTQNAREERNAAIAMLKDAMEDGTVRTLRGAIKEAKAARLFGDDEVNGGAFALDLLRDAALELKGAEKRKRVTEAQRDLVAKRDKCFIRTEPLGRDRFHSNFVHLESDKETRVWAERDYILRQEPHANTEAVLLKAAESASIGAPEKSNDFVNLDDRDQPYGRAFLAFSRREYHHSSELSAMAKHHWSCYTTDRSLRALVKNLGSTGKEQALKEVLKERLETMALAASGVEGILAPTTEEEGFSSSGDEDAFGHGKIDLSEEDAILVEGIPSAMGRRVRLRLTPDPEKAPDFGEYVMGSVTGWKLSAVVDDDTATMLDIDEEATPPPSQVPTWKIGTDDGGDVLATASEVVRGIVRGIKWSTGHPSYIEHDAPFLSYRNNLGRFCGRAVEAPTSTTPQAFAKQMIKREQELYTPLKNRTLENNWGGKAGARQVWVSSLKETGYSFEAVREGLLTLENAIFELSGGLGISEVTDGSADPTKLAELKLSGKELLYDNASRVDIELESIGMDVKGLWNNADAREIFHEIIRVSKTVSILALGLDLVCRNAQAYINRTKSSAPTHATNSYDNSAMTFGRRRAAASKAGAYSDFF